jgi:hypothetical protein
MDAARINAKIYQGRGKAALRIGFPCAVYRPTTQQNPLSDRITTIKAAFNAADNAYLRPAVQGKPLWFGDFDGRITKPGDYLIRQTDGKCWFIADQQPLLPIVCVDCSRSLYIERQPCGGSSVGVTSYSGQADPKAVIGNVDTPWPCSILTGGRIQASTGLPGGVREAAWTMLLPPSIPCTIKSGDIAFDDLQRRFAIESAELSDLGWRLMATEVHT